MRRFGVVLLMALSALSTGCSDPQKFEDTQKRVEDFINIRNLIILGQDRQVFSKAVPADAIHPHFEGRWTVLDAERPVDVYVLKAENYDPAQPLPAQNYFWSSTTSGIGVGQSRSNELHLHPTPGNWVLVFFNPGLSPQANRTDLSAEITFTFFK